MVEIPGAESQLIAFVRKPYLWDALIAITVLCGAIAAALHFYEEGKTRSFAMSIGVAVAVAIFTLCKIGFQYSAHKQNTSLHSLEGGLHTLNALLLDCHPNPTQSPGLRVTVHKPVDGGNKLQQVVEYIGDQRRPGGAGRCFLAQCGIIGEALRTKKTTAADRITPEYESYIKELIGPRWHYTEKDARARDPASMSWLAIPLVSDENGVETVAGVVYADSTISGFFDPDKVYVAQVACAGIARFVESRYK